MGGRLFLSALLFLSFFAQAQHRHEGPFLHEDLGLGGAALHSILRQQVRPRTHPLDPVLRMGERLYSWVEFINEHRLEDELLSLSSPENTRAYPIDSPIFNNEALVLEAYAELQESLPLFMREILFEGEAFVADLPIGDEEFIEHGLEVDRVYSRASRWLLQEPYLASYAARKKSDIRGFYYFQQIEDIETFFLDWEQLSLEEHSRYRRYLVGLCFNSRFTTESFCQNKLNRYERDSRLRDYYEEYFPVGEEKWNSFFRIRNARRDVQWSSRNEDLMVVPFQSPEDPAVEEFLWRNIEDEWQWNFWQLRLDFENANRSSAYIVFEEGATPNVNGLGGNRITMDANRPLSEYSVQWTIRHEYGHVLGIPDCYIEFYDSQTEEMVSYQIDIENLMCSRRGHIKETHYDELRRVYFSSESQQNLE